LEPEGWEGCGSEFAARALAPEGCRVQAASRRAEEFVNLPVRYDTEAFDFLKS